MSMYQYPESYRFPTPIARKQDPQPLLVERGPFRTGTLHCLLLPRKYGVESRLCRVNRQKIDFLTQNREVEFEVMPTAWQPFDNYTATFEFEEALARRIKPLGGAA